MQKLLVSLQVMYASQASTYVSVPPVSIPIAAPSLFTAPNSCYLLSLLLFSFGDGSSHRLVSHILPIQTIHDLVNQTLTQMTPLPDLVSCT